VLGHGSVNNDIRFQGVDAAGMLIYQHRDRILPPEPVCVTGAVDPHRRHAVDGDLTINNGLRKRDCAADHQRAGEFKHKHPEPAAVQPVYGSGHNVSAASDHCCCINCNHVLLSSSIKKAGLSISGKPAFRLRAIFSRRRFS
jgi:hypothetical protein